MAEIDPLTRFSDRVADYVRYRPSYPSAAVDVVVEWCGLKRGDRVADVGSGTGIFTTLLLDRGLAVAAVEPNVAMRAAAEKALGRREGFTSVAGSAEATQLADGSVAAITAAQAFHWFDPEPVGREFKRILAPGGGVALIWNDRRTDTTAFLRAYEQLLRTHGTDYTAVDHKQVDDQKVAAFFSPGTFVKRRFAYRQVFDFEGLTGRVRSCSYVPQVGKAGYEAMLVSLRELFDRHEQDGQVAFEYDTLVYCGRFES